MNAEELRKIPTVMEFFKISESEPLAEGTRLLLEAMEEKHFKTGEDIVSCGAGNSDGMYIILSGTTDVLSCDGELISTQRPGEFIGELALINDDKRGATVRASSDVVCANISKNLFEEIASANRKIYGTFMNMLYTKTTKLVTEQERVKADLAIATRIQSSSLEDDFTEINAIDGISITAKMRPAKEIGGDFYDIFMIDDKHLCFLISDVSGKGVPAALFMAQAKTHLRNFASLGLPLSEVASRANDQICYKNKEGMFVTSFICILEIGSNTVTFVNAGHNHPFISDGKGNFKLLECKANLPFGLMNGVPYKIQTFELNDGESIYLYTDGVTESVDKTGVFFGEDRCAEKLFNHKDMEGDPVGLVNAMFKEIDEFAVGMPQADDITMVYLTRR